MNRHRSHRRVLATAAALGLAAAAATVLAGCPGRASPLAVASDRSGCADRCALPRGFDVAKLDREERAAITSRTLLCMDLECGRLSKAEYLARIGGGTAAPLALATALVVVPPPPPPPPLDVLPPPDSPIWSLRWASAVRAFSSEYGTDSWSARAVLGPPDVWPTYGDDTGAWAAAEEDRVEPEFLELGFDGDLHIDGLEAYETYNPGAISRVEVMGKGGEKIVVFEGKPSAGVGGGEAKVKRLGFACTPFAVVAVRITLDSAAVPGWNEIDAVGAHPCGGAMDKLLDWVLP